MITTAVAGVILLFVMAGVVGVVDALQRARWRAVAAQRRVSWEQRQCPGSPVAR
jgi:hypothetical protein